MGWYVVKWLLNLKPQVPPSCSEWGLDSSFNVKKDARVISLMKKLDIQLNEEYANRVLTECSTMEVVLFLSFQEYVFRDQS